MTKKMLILALFAVVACGVYAADYKPMAENSRVTIKSVTTTTATLTAAESGQIVYVTGTNSTITLPSAAAGLNYIIVRGSATAGHDVVVAPGSGDTINSLGAAGTITNDVDAIGRAVKFVAMDATVWVTLDSSTDW